jgi:hypothetical protein
VPEKLSASRAKQQIRSATDNGNYGMKKLKFSN